MKQNPDFIPTLSALTSGEVPFAAKDLAVEQLLEEALRFLVLALTEKPRRGKKPVVLHSLRVAYRLLALGYDVEVVIAGLLHDILEKSALTATLISHYFGAKTAVIVAAVTNDSRIANPLTRYEDSILRCVAAGQGALAVRTVDLLDNADRLIGLASPSRLARLADKIRLLLRSREDLADPRLSEELHKRLRRVSRRIAEGDAVPTAKSDGW